MTGPLTDSPSSSLSAAHSLFGGTVRVSRHSSIHPHTPPRVEIRPASRADMLTHTRGLTARDAEVIQYLARHRVLTALQLARLVFGSYSHARSRLAVLHERGVLARFRRDIWPGSQPWRYTLGPVGAVVHAAATGAALPRPGRATETVLRLAHSAHTEHRLGVNDFFATLAGHAQQHDDCTLSLDPPLGLCVVVCRDSRSAL